MTGWLWLYMYTDTTTKLWYGWQTSAIHNSSNYNLIH